MNTIKTLILTSIIATISFLSVAAYADTESDKERLKISAIEALMASPSEKALPVLTRVMSSNNSDAVKARALFVLSQIDNPVAHDLLLTTARTGSADLKAEAIRTIGIGGNPELIKQLQPIFQAGDEDVKRQVLQAYLIAGDAEAIYQAALVAEDDDVFDTAVSRLGAMGAKDQLKRLRDKAGNRSSLIHAYAISGDIESLLSIARDGSNIEQQMQAIRGLGIAGGGSATGESLVEIFRETDNADVKEAVMRGMMVGGFDSGLLVLFRESTDPDEKASLLRELVIMDSDAAMDAIDAALAE